MSLEAVLSRIASGESVSSSELLPYLCIERREQRANANLLLAEAYFESGRQDNLPHAKVFIRRAWLLSRFSPELLPLYTRIYSALDDVPGIRDAYKRVGMMMAAEGNVSEAIRHFDLWQYAYISFKNLDKYEYDFDILECMDRLAGPHRFSPKPRSELLKDGKIRVAYLVKGINELGSVLVKINLLFARFHDRSRVEPMFFVPESKNAVLASEVGREHLRLFESHGCELYMGPDVRATEDRLLAVASTIHSVRPDVLITSAGLAQFEHYFITSLRPAPFVIGFVQGPPEQFAPPALDWGLAWSKHPLIDCPVNCTLIRMDMELPERSELVPYEMSELGLPSDAFVVATAGRFVKFQEPEFWRAVIELLDEHPRLYYLAMGVEEALIPFLPSMLSQETRSRIRFLGWRGDDYLRTLCMTDIVIDTFPSGGGAVLSDAWALGIPVVTFRNNYMRLYDQNDWSPAEELIDMPEVIVPRGDFAQMKRVVSRLIEDSEHRLDIGRRSQAQFRQMWGNPARAIRTCEDAYFRILEQELLGHASATQPEIEVEELARRRSRPQIARPWVARAAQQLNRALRLGERALDRIATGRPLLRRRSP